MTSVAERLPSTDAASPAAVETDSPARSGQREIRYEHSQDLAGLLESLSTSLLISTYQAGKVAVVGADRGKLDLSLHNFDRPMGMAVDRGANTLAVAVRSKVWFLRNARDIASQLQPAGVYGGCWLTRSADVTGEIQAHEMAWQGSQLWIVNTLFSCLCTLHADFSFVPRWQPPFITDLVPEDRCHLNGLAMLGGKPKYVTAMAESDSPGGWRPTKAESGCLIDVESGRTVARGFAMPHSPRVHLGHVWLLDSGRGALVRVNPQSGEVATTARFPGYTRGLAMVGKLAFVGLSRIRETSTFGGVPIAEDRERLKCGVAIIDLESGQLAGQLEFITGVEEIFDVAVIPGGSMSAMRGPFSADDGLKTIWKVPSFDEPG